MADNQISDTACRFHTAPPIFHDTRKGWGCCEKRVYDWDEFEQLEGGLTLLFCCSLGLLVVFYVGCGRMPGQRGGRGRVRFGQALLLLSSSSSH